MKNLKWVKKTSTSYDIEHECRTKGQMIDTMKFNSCISYVFEISNKAFNLWLHDIIFWS